jgi:catechol 2,3-dioxygenase-like lactoylglutathione lyase family enzyme
MIRGLHAMFYSSDAEATRAFLRDKLDLPFTDVGDGWLIFDFPEGEAGCHPVFDRHPRPGMDFSFYCDDVEATVAALREKGVEFKNAIEDRGWGLALEMLVPGGIEMTLYQPRYKKQG